VAAGDFGERSQQVSEEQKVASIFKAKDFGICAD